MWGSEFQTHLRCRGIAPLAMLLLRTSGRGGFCIIDFPVFLRRKNTMNVLGFENPDLSFIRCMGLIHETILITAGPTPSRFASTPLSYAVAIIRSPLFLEVSRHASASSQCLHTRVFVMPRRLRLRRFSARNTSNRVLGVSRDSHQDSCNLIAVASRAKVPTDETH